MVIRPYLVAGCAVLPLAAPALWSGFRLGLSDPVLGFVSNAEQPLSVRHAGALWAMLLVVAWFGLAYWQRRLVWWEVGLVLLGGTAALLRAGNLWVLALALLVPLARRLGDVHGRVVAIEWALVPLSLLVGVAIAVSARPVPLPPQAVAAVASASTDAAILADARWANDLQQRLGGSGARQVLDAGSVQAHTGDFWIDYLRVEHGHERWDAILQARGAGIVVLDATGDASAAANLLREAPDWRVTYDAEGAIIAERL